jgi:hypothetical protein
MRAIMFFALLSIGGTAVASAQYNPRYWIVMHANFEDREAAIAAGTYAPDRVVAGPYYSYSDCAADIHIYQGGDYRHIYSCELRS